MNKNSIFTKAIAGLLAVLMVFGTLVSLRGLSVVKAEAKAEPKAESEGTRSGGTLIGPQLPGDDGIDFRIDTESGFYTIYEIPHSYVTYYKYVQVPFYGWDYKLQSEVGWFDNAAVDVGAASTFLSYGSDVSDYELTNGHETGSNPKQLVFHAQDEYWEAGAKTHEGGKRIPYTSPCAENMQDWLDDEAINHLPNGNGLFANKTTANQNYWISGLTGEQIWDRVRVLLYMSDPTRSEEAQALYDELYTFINGTIFPEMKNETFRYTGVTTGSTDGVGCLIRVGNGYLGANVTTQHEVLGEGKDAKPVDRLIVDWKNEIDQDTTYELFYQLLIQHAILAFTSGGYYDPNNTGDPNNQVSGWNMGQGPDGHSRVERARMTNWGTPYATDEHDQNSGYVRRIVNKLVAMAENVDNINAAKNDEDFSFCYLTYDKEKNNRPDMNPDDMYHYQGYFLAGAPVGESPVGEASVDKDAYLTENGTYNIELYVKSNSSATTVDGKTMDGTTVIKDELSDKFKFNGTPEFEYKLIDPNGNVIKLPDGVTITSTVNGSKVEFTGFPFNEYPNYELVITIKNIVAKDNTDGFGNENISTNADTGTVPGVYSEGGNTPGKDGMDNELKFPERKVSIRYRYVIYDFGLEMKDDVHFNEFFNDENMHAHHAQETPIEKILTVDYMFGKVNTNPYSKVYPYDGARIMNDETGAEETYTEGGYHHFTFGFNETADGTRGYFQPNEISHRDWNASALLQLQHDSSAWEGSYTRNRYANPKYEWCTIRFIPATNVLYEADQNYNSTTNTSDFAEFHNGGISGGTAWSCEGTPKPDAHQEHYNDRYGYDANYNGQLNQDSNGSAMKVVVTEDLYVDVRDKGAKWPSMNFDFTGSGFSFSTRCGIDTGIFVIDVVPKGENQFYNSGDANTYKHTLINTRYYGGSGYEANDNVIVKSSLLHQVPVIRITDLAYGNYTVYITPVYLPAWADVPNPDGTDANVGTKGAETVDLNKLPGFEKAGYTVTELFPEPEQTKGGYIHLSSFTCYIDTIRVYHPRGQEYIEEAIDDQEAYYATNELNNRYVEVRKLLISAIDSLMNNTSHDGMLGGAMFIDYGPQITVNGKPQYINGDDFDPKNPDTFTIDHYKFYGPNNELYLNQNGSYSFSLSNPKDVTNLHLSMKVTGAATDGKVEILLLTEDRTGGLGNIDEGKNVIKSYVVSVKSATEMYYDIALVSEGTDLSNLKAVAIKNTSLGDDAIISIMNIKIVHKNGVTAPKSVTDPDIVTTLETAEFANVIGFGIKGDVNGDRSVNMMDAIMLIRGALGGESLGISATFCADVDGNGTIDMVDALNTMRLALEN